MTKGFTLVELSIVLVIIGLVISGVIFGREMIRASELRSVTKEFTQYQSAIMTFRGKYSELPGDMPNAANIWGARDAGDGLGNDCVNAAVNGLATCNGDGNRKIEYSFAQMEHLTFWQHLANSGLIEGAHTGKPGVSQGYSYSDQGHVPKSKIGNAYWYIWPYSYDGHSYMTDTDEGNKLCLGELTSTGPDTHFGPFLTATEMWNIDKKIDDGRPMTGTIKPIRYKGGGGVTTTGCSNAATSDELDAEYNIGYDDIRCAILFEKPGGLF